MRRKLQAKLNSKKGFTLVELLIVVAIIAILVAISIPLVNTSLDKARVATDQANERAARAAATVQYLMNDEQAGTFAYDAENGKLVAQGATLDGYGQCKAHKGGYLEVTVSGTGEISMKWIGGSVNNNGIHGVTSDIAAAEGD